MDRTGTGLGPRSREPDATRAWAVLGLAAFYALATALVAFVGVAYAPAPAAVHAASGSTGAMAWSATPADNNTTDNGTGDNSSGDDGAGDQGSNNSSTCGSNASDNSQGDDNSQGNEDSQGNNSTSDSNGSSGDLVVALVHPSDNNTTGNESDDNETGDNETGDSGSSGNDTSENDTGSSGGCAGDPPVTFKALGLPSGSTWSVTAGSPATTETNTTVGHKGSVLFMVSNGTLNYTITGPSGFAVQRIVGPGVPSLTSDNISGTTVLTVRFAAIQTLSFSESGLPSGSVWSVAIWSAFPHGGPTGFSGTNTTSGSGGVITFSVPKGPWHYNVTLVPANFTAHPTHGTVGVVGHPVTKHLRFHMMPAAVPLAPALEPLAAPVRS